MKRRYTILNYLQVFCLISTGIFISILLNNFYVISNYLLNLFIENIVETYLSVAAITVAGLKSES